MKGFMKDDQFHPIKDCKKGVRMSRDQTAKTVGVRLKRESEKPKEDDMVPLNSKKEILIGLQNDGTAVALELHLERDYFSITGDEYEMNDIITEDDGQQRAKEYLEDGELWKLAVESGSTTSSLDDFIEDVLNIDGWQHVLGDVYEIGNDKYVMGGGGGQIDVSNKLSDWDKLNIREDELSTIKKAWKKLHLKNFKDMTEQDKKLMDQTRMIFAKYGYFNYEDLGMYAE